LNRLESALVRRCVGQLNGPFAARVADKSAGKTETKEQLNGPFAGGVADKSAG
jgi:hypothetical protein